MGVAIDAGKKAAETMANAPELKPTGRPSGQEEKVANGHLSKGSNHKDRLAARLKRDHPAIAARVANGEFKSIRKKPTSPTRPQEAHRRISHAGNARRRVRPCQRFLSRSVGSLFLWSALINPDVQKF